MKWRIEEEGASIRTVQIGEMWKIVVLYRLENRRARDRCQLCMDWRILVVELYFLEKYEKKGEISLLIWMQNSVDSPICTVLIGLNEKSVHAGQ